MLKRTPIFPLRQQAYISDFPSAKPRQKMKAVVTYGDGTVTEIPIICRIDTQEEVGHLKNRGILQYVLRDLAA